FRGFLLAGLRGRLRPALLCLTVGVVFGLFHADLWRIPTTTVLGIILAIACYRSGSILPSIIIHFCNNAAALLSTKSDRLAAFLGTEQPHPPWLMIFVVAAVLAGLALISRRTDRPPDAPGRIDSTFRV